MTHQAPTDHDKWVSAAIPEVMKAAAAGPLTDDEFRWMEDNGLLPRPSHPEYPAIMAINYSLMSCLPDKHLPGEMAVLNLLTAAMSRICKPPPPRLLTTADGAPCILDPRAYGAIVDRVIAHVDHRTRLALWGTCFALYTHLSAHFYRHITVGTEPLLPDGSRLPYKFKNPKHQEAERADALGRYTRICDLMLRVNLRKAAFVIGYIRSVRVIRMHISIDFTSCPAFPSPNVVLCTASVPYVLQHWGPIPFSLLPHGMPVAPRVIINVPYLWPQQLFTSHLNLEHGIPGIPEGVEELVFHFKKVGERPRYLRCVAQPVFYPGPNGYALTFDKRLRATYTSSSTPPVLEPAEYLEVVRPVVQYRNDLFQQLVELYVNTVGRGKRGSRAPRLTLVGLEEFDAARDADAADDEAFERVIDSLPWNGLIPPTCVYRHPAYEPIAPTFVERITTLVHHKKHARVRRDVKILSSTEYLASLEHPADEDWWESNEGGWCECCNEPQCLQGM